MSTIYLYLKTHNVTGLKYLGKTVQDPFEYKGSGTRWTNHIKKHGYDVTTEILFETQDKEEFSDAALLYSNILNVVDSNGFANLRNETGDGGDTFSGRTHSKETLDKIRQSALERPPISEETKQKISESKSGVKLGPYKPRTEEHLANLSKSLKGKPAWNAGKTGYKCKSQTVTCPHCGKTGGSGGMKRFHFDHCKMKGK